LSDNTTTKTPLALALERSQAATATKERWEPIYAAARDALLLALSTGIAADIEAAENDECAAQIAYDEAVDVEIEASNALLQAAQECGALYIAPPVRIE